MGRQLYIRMLAIFLSLLVITLPITFAAQISGVDLQGSIGAGNVAKPGDTITATVNVTAAFGETVDKATLPQRLRLGSGTDFTSGCTDTPTSGLFTCTTTFVIGSALSGVIISPVDVLLYSDATRLVEVDRAAGAVIVDGVAPTISVSGLSQAGMDAKFTLTAKDTALAINTPASCSGVNTINLFWRNATGDTPVAYAVASTDVGNCSYVATPVIPVLATGTFSLCANVTDRAGLSRLGCGSAVFDLTAPVVSNISFSTANGPTQYITNATTASLYVTFNSTTIDLTQSNVTVDGVAYGPITCDGLGGCKSGVVSISPTKLSYDVVINAQSKNGIVTSVPKTLSVSVDAVAPVFTSLKSNITVGNNIYFKPGLSLTAHFAEQASGLGNRNAKLVIEGATQSAPSRCVKSSTSGWDCIWDNLAYTSLKQGNLSAVISATDLLGNVGDAGNATIIYDDQAPVVDWTHLNISAISNVGVLPVAVSGSTIKISFNVTESSTPVRVIANFSSFETLSDLSTGTCTTTRCDVTSTPVGKRYYNAPATITVIDLLGNNITTDTRFIEVLSTTNETNTSYFKHSLLLTPAALEQTTFPYINQRGFAQVDIKGVGSGTGAAQVLKVDFKQCRNIPVVTIGAATTTTSTFSTTSSTVGDTRLFNSAPQATLTGDSQILLGFTFKATTLNQSNVQFLCDFDVSGRVGDTFIPKETETVLVNFSTYNMSVGELGANYDKKLNDQINKAKNHIGAKLAMFEKLFDIAKKICNLWKLWLVGTTAWKATSEALKTTSGVVAATVVGLLAAAGIDTTGALNCDAAETVEAVGDVTFKVAFSGFCSFISCQIGLTNLYAAATADTSKGAALALSGQTGGVGSLAAKGASALGASTSASNWANAVVSSINPEDTLAGAIVNMCIPAIIRSLRRAQQIECQYAVCLRDEVPKGVPIEACDQAYEYSSCMYKTANFFIIFAIWDAMINKIKSLISDPFAVAGLAGAAICAAMCHAPPFTGLPHAACTIPRAIGKIGNLVGMIAGIKDDWTKKNYEAQDYCAQLN